MEATEQSSPSQAYINEPLDPATSNRDSEKIDSLVAEERSSASQHSHLAGRRLHLLTFCVCCSVFLPNFEVTVVSTALVNIANDLQAFNKTAWIIIGYLTTYTGLVIIWAKLSDIIGRKVALTASLVLFTAFSGGCGAAQTITQMIVLRALQGLGGAGCFSVASIIVFEMVPRAKYPLYGTLISVIVALATLLGPVIGGAISQSVTWRWVFLINVPIGVLTTGLLFIALPNGFPYHDRKSAASQLQDSFSNRLKRMDFIGTFLFLGASFTFVTALLETSTHFQWSSAPTISLVVVSGVLAISFLLWERHITLHSKLQEPIFPWRFVHNRAWIGMLMVSLLLGVPFAVLVVSIPQKLQTVSNSSPLDSGLRLLPYALFAPFGAALANGFVSKWKTFPPVIFVITGACIQLIGLSLFSIYGAERGIDGKQYACQIVSGLGLGMMFGTLVVMTPSSVEMRDLATATGAIVQFRQFGSIIGLSIATSVLNAKLRSKLPSVLSPAELNALLQSTAAIHGFPSSVKLVVEDVFIEGYSLQFKILTAFAGACVLAALMAWKKK